MITTLKEVIEGQQLLKPEKVLDDYSKIELTPEETEAALNAAKKAKMHSLNMAEYNRKVYAEKEIPKFTAEKFMEAIITMAHKRIQQQKKTEDAWFTVDEYNKDFIWRLCLYFTNDQRFNELTGAHGERLSLTKGIAIFGGVGTGKTFIMRLFLENPKRSFIIRPCVDVAAEYQEHSDAMMSQYMKPAQSLYSNDIFGHKMDMGVCFDDLGTENDQKNYGNTANVMSRILMARYDKSESMDFPYTHITTNLSADEIEKNYGTRVRSRMAEMFNVFYFDEKAPDRRKM